MQRERRPRTSARSPQTGIGRRTLGGSRQTAPFANDRPQGTQRGSVSFIGSTTPSRASSVRGGGARDASRRSRGLSFFQRRRGLRATSGRLGVRFPLVGPLSDQGEPPAFASGCQFESKNRVARPPGGTQHCHCGYQSTAAAGDTMARGRTIAAEGQATPISVASRFDSEEERRGAVVDRDRAAGGEFVYCVKTTGVYCRPGCAARSPRREHVRFHASPEDAENAGFRPCRRRFLNEPPLAERHARAVAAACRLVEVPAFSWTLETCVVTGGVRHSRGAVSGKPRR